VQSDVRAENDVKDLIGTAVKTYGGLHCAFNNAGILPTTSLLADTDASVFDSVLSVDLKGVFLDGGYTAR
jgi:NAD(P)-dependent dehydrogenase (short-subunit alcohol dehydrogenase family)